MKQFCTQCNSNAQSFGIKNLSNIIINYLNMLKVYYLLVQSLMPCFGFVHPNQASNPDELGITEEESLELIADGDGDGWIKVSQ